LSATEQKLCFAA